MRTRTRVFRAVGTQARGFDFRKGFVLGSLFGGTLGIAAVALLPLAAFVVASIGIGCWVVGRVTAELRAPHPGRIID